jgi:hypothetical protein
VGVFVVFVVFLLGVFVVFVLLRMAFTGTDTNNNKEITGNSATRIIQKFQSNGLYFPQ